MTQARQAELTVHQRRWIDGRNGCGQASERTACITTSYGQCILELKTYSAGATGNGGQISFGPVA